MRTRRGFCCMQAQLQLSLVMALALWVAVLVPGWLWWQVGRHALGIVLTVAMLRATQWLAVCAARLAAAGMRRRRLRTRRLPVARSH